MIIFSMEFLWPNDVELGNGRFIIEWGGITYKFPIRIILFTMKKGNKRKGFLKINKRCRAWNSQLNMFSGFAALADNHTQSNHG